MTNADLIALARDLIAKVRANGHDVCLDPGFAFRLSVREAGGERPLIQNKGMVSFAVGVDLTPYEPLFASPERDRIFGEALKDA